MYTFNTIWAFYRCVDCFNISILLSWMFDCLDTCCLGVSYPCVLHFCICICSAQLSVFHMERRFKNTIIIIMLTQGQGLACGTVTRKLVLWGLSSQVPGKVGSVLRPIGPVSV